MEGTICTQNTGCTHTSTKRTSRHWLRIFAMYTFVVLLLTASSMTTFAQCQPGQITVDGNPCDWNNISGFGIQTYVPDPHGNTVDNQFTLGSKDFNLASELRWSVGQTKDKGDIANAAAVLIGDSLYFAGDRTSNNGAAQIGFWFYLNGTAPNTRPDGTQDFAPEHAVGDLFVLADFTNGGNLANVTVYQWVGTGGNVPNTNGTLSTFTANAAVAINNSTLYNVPMSWSFPTAMYETNEFYEGVIDLSGLNLPSICFSTFLLETRSSPSITASLEDFVAGGFPVRPTVSINNQVVCAGQTATFTATATGGIAPLTYSFNGGAFQASNQFTYTPTMNGSVTVVVKGGGQSACLSNIATGTVTVVPAANAGADGSTAICDNSVATINLFDLITGEQAGGVWTRLSGSGGTFDAGAGTYIPATGATTSTFQYMLTATSPCPNDASVATVNISAAVNAGADGSIAVCDNSVAAINLFNLITGEQAGGVWSRTSGTGGTFNAGAGTYTPAAGATSSTFQYLVTAASPCPNDASVATVNISAAVNAGGDGSIAVCDNSVAAINLFNLITGEQAGGVWSRTSGTGGTFNAGAGTYTPAAGATTSTFQYLLTAASPCPNDASVATVNISAAVNAGADGSIAVCDNSVAAINLFDLITGEQAGGVWSRTSGTGGTFNAGAGTYTPAAGATTSTFQYLITAASPCPNDASVATVNISAAVNAGADGNIAVCDNSVAAINLFNLITGEQAGGVWTRTSGTGGTFNAGAGTYTPAAGATSSTFQYLLTAASPCPNDASVATVNISAAVNAGVDGGIAVCLSSTAIINLFDLITGEQAGGVWSRTSGTGGTFNAGAGTYTPAAGATTSTFQYLVTAASPCPNDVSVATVNVSEAANAGADGSIAVCDNSVAAINLFNLITGEQAGGVWTRTSGTGGTFNGGAGTYTPASGATTSTFQYLITAASPCPNDASVATVNISAAVNAGADGSIAVCDNSVAAINLFNLITGEQAGGVWSRTSGTGGTFNAGAGTYTPAAGATTSTFQYLLTAASPCPNDASVATVNISAAVNAGADGNTRVCNSSVASIDLAALISGEQTGGVWSRLTGSGGTFNAAAGTFVPNGATTSTFQYLVAAQSPCPNDASVATVNVDAQAIGGIVSSFVSECPRETPELNGTLTLSGHTGSVVKWQSAISPDGPWTDIANTTTTLIYTDLLFTTYFRAVIVSGVCPLVYSAPGVVLVEECQIPTAYCTFTQGAYGSAGGMMCNGDGTSSATLARIQAAIAAGGTSDGMGGFNVIFGRVTPQNRYWTLSSSDAANVLKMLPGGGGSMKFESRVGGGRYSLESSWFVAPLQASGPNKGKIRNTLFAQTMTMFFNLNTSAGLGSVAIADTLITAAMDCGTTTILPGTNEKWGIPSDIVDYLAGANGYTNNINGLYNLANDVLGGVNTQVNPSSVATAVDRLNNAFDECRFLVSSIVNPESARGAITQQSATLPLDRSGVLNVGTFPNPYNDQVTFKIESNESGKGRLDVYNMMGQKVKTVFEGNVLAGKSQTIQFNVPVQNRSSLIYRLTIGNKTTTGKILYIN